MPALTFDVTANGVTTAFPSVQAQGVRQALDFDAGSPEYRNDTFEIPGVDGVFVTRHGQRAGRLSLTVRYYGPIATAAAAWETDRNTFAKYNCIITNDITSPSETYSRCTLQPNGANRIAPEKGDIDGNIIFDCKFDFRIDEL